MANSKATTKKCTKKSIIDKLRKKRKLIQVKYLIKTTEAEKQWKSQIGTKTEEQIKN